MVSSWSGRGAGGMWTLLVLLAGSAAVSPELPDLSELPELSALRCHHERCRYVGSNHPSYVDDIYVYEVEGYTVQIHQIHEFGINQLYVTISCYGASVLESPALPRAETTRSVSIMMLENCPLPSASLAKSITALNFKFCEPETQDTPYHGLTINNLPAAPPVAAKHFVGLECVSALDLSTDTRASPERGFLAPLQSLVTLELRNVTLPAGELDVPPPSLEDLKLRFTGIELLPEAIHSSVGLRELSVVSESSLDAIAVPPGLRELRLESLATTLRLDSVVVLEILEIYNWIEPLPPPLTRCDNLRTLHLMSPTMRVLPDGWLVNCSALEELVIQNAHNLITLPPQLFHKRTLTRLTLRQGALEKLPEKLLDDMINLKSLELNNNRLQTLPRYLFSSTSSLSLVDLSSNDLDGNVVDALGLLPYLHLLNVLDLSHNARISVICDENGYSPISNASDLNRLILSETGVTRICRDWREELTYLDTLDLSHTNVSELSFTDLRFTRDVKADVWLLGVPVTVVGMTREDYNNATHTPPSFTSVHIDVELECDCRMYWTRRTLEHTPNMLDRVSELSCAGGRRLRDVPLEDMVCGRPEECAAVALPAPCACGAVLADDDPDYDQRLVRVRCENASLTQVPRLRTLNHSTERLYELLLANNQIEDLHANDMQDNIKGLDLRNNSLRRVNEETAMKLANVSGVLQLAGNPLECDCHAAPLLRALHSRAPGDTDLDMATCHDGRLLYKAPIVDCPKSTSSDISLATWLPGVLAVLLALALTITAFLASRERRFFVLAVLHRWGCVWRPAELEDDGCRYDLFVTFSHVDLEVVHELVARLEPTYRLCVHYRDWIPGRLISEQVVESVSESRRTVALVSRHFLASSWPRAEFREAHTQAMLDARPRLIVVLLEDPATLQLDDQLQRYIKTNTYVRWGDPWFWDKLKLALPPPRPAGSHHPSLPCQLAMPRSGNMAIQLSPVDSIDLDECSQNP